MLKHIHHFQIGYIDSVDWKDRTIKTVYSIVKPKTDFLNRKAPCDALRDFEIDLAFAKKHFDYACQIMQLKIQEELEQNRIKRMEEQHILVWKDLYGSDEDENFEDFLKNNAYP